MQQAISSSSSRKRYIYLIPLTFFLMTSYSLFASETNTPVWKTGRVVQAVISGHGPSEKGKYARSRRNDIFWIYMISADHQSFSVISRVSPQKTGMKANTSIKFSVEKNQIRILNSEGKSFIMRILRQKTPNQKN
jgi:hypothetical protein